MHPVTRRKHVAAWEIQLTPDGVTEVQLLGDERAAIACTLLGCRHVGDDDVFEFGEDSILSGVSTGSIIIHDPYLGPHRFTIMDLKTRTGDE